MVSFHWVKKLRLTGGFDDGARHVGLNNVGLDEGLVDGGHDDLFHAGRHLSLGFDRSFGRVLCFSMVVFVIPGSPEMASTNLASLREHM